MNNQRPTPEMLVRFVMDECTAAEQVQVAKWAASGEGREMVGRIRLMVDTLRTNGSVEAPRMLIQKARDLFPQVATGQAGRAWWDTVRTAVADLLFDGRTGAIVPGFRGGASTAHVLYANDAGELDLQQVSKKADGTCEWRGQVDAVDGVAGEVVFVSLADPDEVVLATPDEAGEFRVELALGEYRVVCRLGESAIEIPRLRIE